MTAVKATAHTDMSEMMTPTDIIKAKFHAKLEKSQAMFEKLSKSKPQKEEASSTCLSQPNYTQNKRDVLHRMCLYAHFHMIHKQGKQLSSLSDPNLEAITNANLRKFQALLAKQLSMCPQASKGFMKKNAKMSIQKKIQIACLNSIALEACEFLENEIKKKQAVFSIA